MKWLVMKMDKQPVFDSIESEAEHLANRAFSIIDLVEVADISEQSFILIRKKLLNLGNDIKRLPTKHKVGD